jgi:hypothetical protein
MADVDHAESKQFLERERAEIGMRHAAVRIYAVRFDDQCLELTCP